MSDYELAVKQMDLPRCPHCGELVMIERFGAVWHCDICGKDSPAVVLDVPNHPQTIGLFKVLPR